MSLFDRIKSKIFGSAKAAEAQSQASAPAAPAPSAPAPSAPAPAAPAPTPATASPAPQPTPASTGPTPAGVGTPVTTAAAPASQTPAAQSVDVAAILNEKQKSAGQSLDWRRSIVDLLKLLDLDSSLAARKELASELGYTGDSDDSATMNVWLHKQVMRKLAENGGNVPADLRD